MFLSMACLLTVLSARPTLVAPPVPLAPAVERWVGQTRAQIEAKLGEEPITTRVVGGTANAHLSCTYANSRVVVLYKADVAVNLFRAK
jgi:hypothetical protein